MAPIITYADVYPKPKLRRWFISITAIIGSIVIGFVLLGFELDDFEQQTGSDAGFSVSYVGVSILLGLLSFVLLPIALQHSDSELDVANPTPGPRRALIAGVLLGLCSFSHFAAITSIVGLISLFSRRSSGWMVTGSAAALLAAVINLLLIPAPIAYPDALYSWKFMWLDLIFLAPLLIIGVWRGQRREQSVRKIAAAHFAEERMAQAQDLARRDERTRIARDMHDSLAHRLSLISVHASALAYRDDLAQDEQKQAALTVHDQAQKAVDDLRDVLQVLRNPSVEQPSADISELIDQARRAGTNITWVNDAPQLLENVSTLTGHMIYRFVQEGLTNARKHAPNQPVTITLNRLAGQDHDAELRISNPMTSASSRAPSHNPSHSEGTGLTGLKERALLTGAKFHHTISETNGQQMFRLALRFDTTKGTSQ